jgi:hypothetical protein
MQTSSAVLSILLLMLSALSRLECEVDAMSGLEAEVLTPHCYLRLCSARQGDIVLLQNVPEHETANTQSIHLAQAGPAANRKIHLRKVHKVPAVC